MQRILPNVYQELQECLLHGARLVVKNTFVDIDDSTSTTPIPKSMSMPTLPSIQCLLEMGEAGEHRITSTPLVEVRNRVFSEIPRRDAAMHADKDIVCAAVTTCARDSLRSEPHCLSSVDARSSMSSQETGSLEDLSTTTFMIRSLPRHMTRTKLEDLLDDAGFAKQYDFIYLPANLKVKESYGYGFVNLVSGAVAARFMAYFNGYSWPDRSQEPMGVHKSEALEGLDALIQRYRNSPLMHSSVPEEVRPAIYRDGVKAPFPSPTVDLRAPRMRSLPGQKEQK